MPNEDVFSQKHLQPRHGKRHLFVPKSFVPKMNKEDLSLQASAQSATVRFQPTLVSDPSHSFLSATNFQSVMKIIIDKRKLSEALHNYYL